jgi:hypothetical protein
MTSLTITPSWLLGGVGALCVVLYVWRVSARRARAAADAVRAGSRLASLAGRVVFNAVLIVGAQWVVIKHPGSDWLLLAVLGLPALFAAHTLTRALTVTTIEPSRRRRDRRR